MAYFQLEGIDPSFIDQFMRTTKGFAIASAPSLTRRAGMLGKPGDLLHFSFSSSLNTKDSLICESLKLYDGYFIADLDADNTESIPCLNVTIVDEKY